MGDMVNVVKPDGTIVQVEREVAEALTGQKLAPHIQTPQEASEQARSDYNREHTSPVAAGVAAGVNTAFFGAPGLFYSDDTKEAIKQHPTAAKIGTLGAVLAPTGLLGKTAKGLAEATFLGRASQIGAGGGTFARAAEGGITGAGIDIANSTISDDPLTAESLVESIGMGSLLSVGIGAASDKALGWLQGRKVAPETGELLAGAKGVTERGPAPLARAARAQAALDEAEAVAASTRDAAALDHVIAQAKADVLATKKTLDELPAYSQLRDGYNAARKAAEASNRELAAQTAALDDWSKPGNLKSTLGEYEGAQNKVRTLFAKARAAEKLGPGTAGAIAGQIDDLHDAVSSLDDLQRFSKGMDLADPAAASALYSKMSAVNAKLEALGVSKFPRLPELVSGEAKVVGNELPASLTDFGKMKEETVAKIAASLDDQSKMAAVKMAKDLSIDADTAEGALEGIRTRMRDMYHVPTLAKTATKEAAAAAKAEAAAAKAETANKFKEASEEVDRARQVTGGRLEWTFKDGQLAAAPKGATATEKGFLGDAWKWTKGGIQSAAARAAYTGGWKGALVSRLAYGAAGYAVGGMEGALLGASVGSARAETVGRIREVVRSAATRGVTAVAAARPLSGYLAAMGASPDSDHTSLYDGEAAKRLIDDIHAQSITSHDAMYNLSKGLMGMPGDLAYSLYAKTTQAAAYLSAMAPKDPGVNITPTGSLWVPDPLAVHEWLNRYEAVMHPVEYAQRLLAGDGHPAGVEALQTIWPMLHQQLMTEAAGQDWSNLSNEQATGLSYLFGRPVTGANDPDIQMMIQAQYVAAAQAQARAKQGAKKGRGTGNPNGRPPAVNSMPSPGGSNVSAHTKGY